MKDLNEILENLYTFYCVGSPQLIQIYGGYQKIDKIVSGKINEIIEEKDNGWKKLVNAILLNFDNI